MKILVDENIPLLCVSDLQAAGHDVADIRGTEEEGMSDEAVWNQAQRDGRLLVTTDKGFARQRDREHQGILIVLLHRPNRHKITRRIIEVMDLFSADEWRGLLVVMRDTVMSTWRVSVAE